MNDKKSFPQTDGKQQKLITRAKDFAIKAHRRINHRRKYSLEPYDVHLYDVANLVAEVTDVSTPVDGNRASRKALDRAHLAHASWRGKNIKLDDIIDNCRDICRHDPEFAQIARLAMRIEAERHHPEV